LRLVLGRSVMACGALLPEVEPPMALPLVTAAVAGEAPPFELPA
jgi:hypothetical protein